jgi:ferrochelatase
LGVLYDIDTETSELCEGLNIAMHLAATAGTHPRFVQMIRELLTERMSDNPNRPALGNLGPSHDICPVDRCSYSPQRQ